MLNKKSMYNAIKIIVSCLTIFSFLLEIYQTIKIDVKRNGSIPVSGVKFIFSGLRIDRIPNPKVVFVIAEPKRSPMAKLYSFFFTALKSTASSGKDVPNATIVAPTKLAVKENSSAICKAE